MWKSLLTSKGLKEEGLLLLSGEKLVREFLAKPNLEIVSELIPPDGKCLTGSRHACLLTNDLFKQVDEVGTHFNILVLKQPKIEKWSVESSPKGLELICPLGDPGNLGALLRSAEAFGATSVILTTESCHPFLPKAVKASHGSVLRMPFFKGPHLASIPQDCWGLDSDGLDITKVKFPRNIRMVVGEEGPGLKNFKPLKKISIPTEQVESLNAVVASSIAMFEYKKQHP